MPYPAYLDRTINVTSLRSFIGMAKYLWRYIEDCAKFCSVLNELLSWSSLIFLWGDAAVVVVVCRALCSHLPRPLSPVLRLSSPPPPPSFSLCVEAAVVCVSPAAGGTKFAARTAIPPRCCSYRATVGCVVFVVDRNKQGRCFTRASPPVASGRLRSPPVASGRLRSPPVASGRLRSPPVASGRLRSPPVTSSRPHSPSTCAMGLGLVQVVPGEVSVGRGALLRRTNAFWGLKHRSQGG